MVIQSKNILKGLAVLCIAMALSACGNSGGGSEPKAESTNTAAAVTNQGSEQKNVSATKFVTDAYDKQVEIPSSPKRIVYTDNTVGDILLYGVKPVGLIQEGLQYAVYRDEVKDVADVGWPPSTEKLIELEPDLIITSMTDAQQLDVMRKIAPVIQTNEWDPMPVRVKRIGDWLGFENQADEFLAKHEADINDMWDSLLQKGTIQSGETASVFQYMLGQKRLSVYTTSYLPTFVYHEKGFKPTAGIQKLIDDPENYGYSDISAEVLPNIAGDRIFIVYFDGPELEAVKQMIKESIWKDLPAVKAGKVYFVNGGLGITTDPLAREELIKQLPIMLGGQS
ncbi:ABC transporter substrate-binding protein [Paenibacillus sp. NPDC057934]|uniref:ABC transporter substrate-binding protein n=1 Tax=Paenibacillus sp. NPDC057934 TaxID=3346282 RepID=UPI0036D83FD8